MNSRKVWAGVTLVAKALSSRAPPPPPPVPAKVGAPAIVFNFDDADVEVVIQAAAELVGFN